MFLYVINLKRICFKNILSFTGFYQIICIFVTVYFQNFNNIKTEFFLQEFFHRDTIKNKTFIIANYEAKIENRLALVFDKFIKIQIYRTHSHLFRIKLSESIIGIKSYNFNYFLFPLHI